MISAILSRLREFTPPIALGLSVFTLAACTPGATLRPGPAADDAAWLDQAAVEDVEGVEIVAQTDAWEGDPGVRDHVTPMRVVIENGHDEAIRVRYQDVALIAADGTRYNALPPYEVRGALEERHVVRHDVRVDPALIYDDYVVAPYVHAAYPRMESYAGRFYHDIDYYDHYHDYWTLHPLPTSHMVSVAIPEGVVRPNGSVEGFFYFPSVDVDHERVRLRIDVAEVERGRSLGEVSIPFVVN